MTRGWVWALAVAVAGAAAAGPAGAQATNASSQSPAVRVAVIQGQSEADVAVHGRFRIVAPEHTQALQEGSRLPEVSVRAGQEGILVGEDLVAPSEIRIEPERDATISLNGQRLRGTLEIVRQQDQTLLIINHVELEDYLRGVLSKEAPHYWPQEALQALTIAARTYTLFQRLTNTAGAYDVTGDVMSQVYGGKSAERWKTNRAVKQTRGLILVDRGRVFPAFYHSTCGGRTEQASVMGSYDLTPLQGGVVCSFCRASPFYQWQQRLTFADLAWAVKKQDRGSVWPVAALEIIEQSPTGRIARLRIRGASRSVELSGYELRAMLGFDRIRSTAFSVVPDQAAVVLQGRGWGHGVGLCQWGTAELARRGFSAEEILSFYYPTASVVHVEDVTLEPIRLQGRS